MATNQPNRRTFFGGVSALFLGMFFHKKVAASSPNPPPPPRTPSVPTSWCSIDEGFGSTTTLSYNSWDDYVEPPHELGDSRGITYTYTE